MDHAGQVTIKIWDVYQIVSMADVKETFLNRSTVELSWQKDHLEIINEEVHKMEGM